MQFVQYFLMTLLASFGPIFGYVVSMYAGDEIKKGRNLIEFALKAILFAIAMIIIISQIGSYSEIVFILAIIVFYFLKNPMIYLAFGVLFFLISFNPEVNMLIYILIFIYFLLHGSIEKSLRNPIISSTLFFLSTILVYSTWFFA